MEGFEAYQNKAVQEVGLNRKCIMLVRNRKIKDCGPHIAHYIDPKKHKGFNEEIYNEIKEKAELLRILATPATENGHHGFYTPLYATFEDTMKVKKRFSRFAFEQAKKIEN